MVRRNRIYLLCAFGVAVLAVFCVSCVGLVMTSEQGNWPKYWPEELEPYRKQTRTVEVAAGIQENVYEISFASRKEFENIWPTILKLKSEGATLKLRSIDSYYSKDVSFFDNRKPVVRIFSHVYPAVTSQRPGGKKLRSGPPWPESVKLKTGQLPEYVTTSKDGNSWVPVGEKTPKGFMYRARTDIEVVVDAEIIDLNRINLPADTKIIDNRRAAPEKEYMGNHKRWIKKCLQRSESIKPGATRKDLLDVYTTEGGISNRQWRRYVYKECPYIKVDVKFYPVDDGTAEKPGDVITEISRPFLEWSIWD